MAKPKFEGYTKGDILIIEWHDAHSVDAWTAPEELENKIAPHMVRTIGFYHKTNRQNVIVCASLGINDPDDDVAGVWVIPKGMIKKIEVVAKPA